MSITINKNIDLDEISFHTPLKYKNKRIATSLYNDEELLIQIKKVNTPFGIYKDNGKYRLDIILEEKYSSLFYNMESNSIKKLFNNYNEWFGYDVDYENLKKSLHSSLKTGNDSSILTLPIQCNDGMMMTEVYDSNKNRINWKHIKRDSTISLILRFNGIRFFKTKFLNDWEIIQIKNHEDYIYEEKFPENVCLIESDSESDLNYSSEDMTDIEDEDIYINDNLVKHYKVEREIEKLNILD